MHHSPLTPDERELDFLAFQYVSNELSDAERIAFEERLLDDQAAREAVARGVELTLAVLVATRERLRASSGRRGWWSVALAATALACLIALSLSIEKAKQRPTTPPGASAALAIAWSETRSEWPTSAVAALDDDTRDALDECWRERDFALPTWMLAAVSQGAADMSESGMETDAMIE
jgi:anti-sigma-K factor RskA